MQLLYERRLLKGAGYRYVLRTDVSRFFPTIYTHSIPWALHGKTTAKANRKITQKYFGNLLDAAVRQCQDEQTFGLPIGPDTSHIIAECIASAVDVELAKKLPPRSPGFRYVDDFYLFFESYSDAEHALTHLVRVLRGFELQINFDKTSICRIEELEDDSWTYALRSLEIATSGRRQRSDINHYFERAREIARSHVDESVMVYALRRASSVIVRAENWGLFEAQICLAAASHPVTLQTVARILKTYFKLGFKLDRTRISRLVNSLIREHAPLEHHSEVAWCLWMCKEFRLEVDAQNVDQIAKMNSAVCSLVLLDLGSSGLLLKQPSASNWKPHERKESLWDDRWMLSYEAGVRGWGGMADAHVRSDEYFNELRIRNVRYYDTEAELRPIFSPKEGVLESNNVDSLPELLEREDLEDLFDYEDEEDSYGSPVDSTEDQDDDEDP